MNAERKQQLEYLYGVINAKSGIDLKKEYPLELEDLSDIEKGKLDINVYNTIYNRHKKSKKLEKDKDIPIILLTKIIESVRLVDEYDVDGIPIDDKDARDTAILYVPALLSKDGKLKPGKDNSLPWIPTGVLAPFGKYVSIGEWKEPPTGIETDNMSWSEYWTIAINMYKEATEEKWEEQYVYDKEQPGRRYAFKNYAYAIYDNTVVSTRHIRKLYQSVLEFFTRDDFSSPLLDKMLSTPLKVEDTPQHPYNEGRIDCMKKHLGVMSGQWTLSPSQRESIHHLKEMADGDVLAVAGPPGTGKTTLLQSVVADLMVEHAIFKKQAPIIVATSTNNKAVVNVIDSFSNVSKDNTDKLGMRWTCAQSLAAFFPSSSKYNSEEYKRYFKTSKRGEDAYAALEEKIDDMTIEYKSRFEECFGKVNGGGNTYWEKVQQRLLQEINKRRKVMCEILDTIYYIEETKKKKGKKSLWRNLLNLIGLQRIWEKSIDDKVDKAYNQLEELFETIKKPKPLDNVKDKESSETKPYYKERLGHITEHMHKSYGVPKTDDIREVNISELNGILDITLRYQMFWLAVHYYEARWLSGEGNDLTEKQIDKTFLNVQDKRLHRMAMLQPCMVMTFFMLPSVFEVYEEKRFPYFQNIDLLIVDESGQVSPEMGLPSFALAKRAIVVGDVHQIPPVWSVNDWVDYKMAYKYGIADDKEVFESQNLNCSASSLMNVSCGVCQFQRYEDERGLFLCEHRRCYEEIIEFCNDLIYKKKLRPVRPDVFEKDKLKRLGKDVPAMGHKHVEHDESESVLGSRRSVEEASAIAEWLSNNLEAVKTAYTKDGKFKIDETIAIITPFKTQVSIIKNALENDSELKKIPCGTVHTFQGAESKIVIFSTVYGKKEGWNFIKKNDNLINVAVSRAKDYFFTFGERSISGGKGVSNNAAQMLIDYTESQLPDKIELTSINKN